MGDGYALAISHTGREENYGTQFLAALFIYTKRDSSQNLSLYRPTEVSTSQHTITMANNCMQHHRAIYRNGPLNLYGEENL